ncbi:MAG: hypothetical protein GTO45_20120 [Candidatus Aminicenantes bacterium]|nr:hypothetical protein [Candidatus Aminicenantes bacterium]NIM81103.1 hypothetical protein [Candidatus Aminicenantes bacterium]NIN20477.1 hypothetical protein [Candidatus Aminicenantes bacterium]NIN44250.1 hypothetical protein [Candidatus Aminicenantes bacterium]NIN87069.1 hypothetical protein [Candidatus Aminicenantes bacterium]
MLNIQKRYIIDENNNKLAVEIDYKTFLKIEEILEDHALYHLIQETEDSDSLTLPEAKKYDQQLLDENGN